ncbi:MAG: sulfotransferase family 2 domain-containing protein [Enhydrobacter sp.]|nr:sulfotransferase family 2 domain-containing protein [Enhydrobacter sp.]
MARDAYVLQPSNVILFWSRKAGNTSLADWLAKGVIVKDDVALGMRSRKFLKTAHHLNVDFRAALELVEGGKFEDFILARNPYQRIVSAYVEKFIYYGERSMDSLSRLKGFAKTAFLEAMLMRGKSGNPSTYQDAYPGISFTQFLEYVRAAVHEHSRRGEPDLNDHWNTQVPLYYDGRFDYSNIIKLERVDEEIRPLALKLQCEVPFPHTRSNVVNARRENDVDLADVSSVEMIKERIVPGSKALLNATTRALIRDAYAIDFRKLGYDPDDGASVVAAVRQSEGSELNSSHSVTRVQ